jgi:hypothetical protein
VAALQDCCADLGRKIDAMSDSSVEQLPGAMSSMNYSLNRNISAEIFILESARDQKDKSCTAFHKLNLT